MSRAWPGATLVSLVLVCACAAERQAAPPPATNRVADAHPPRRAPRPRPVPADPSNDDSGAVFEGDGLTPEQITPVVEQRFPAMRDCHTMEYGGGQALGGSMTVHLQIAADGSVESADIAESSFGNRSLDQCVLDVAKGIRFPAAAAATDFSWRFKFRAPASADARRSSR